jgi:ParB family chromosome partitioning protein
MVNPRPPFASLRSEHPFPEARHLRIDLIDPNPDQPRHVLAGIEELAAHIRDHGLLQPIVVTRAGNGRFTLIAGQRRLAAVRWLAEHDDDPARWRHIPTIIRTVETAERLTLALAENLARHALSDAEVLTAIRVLVDLHGWSQHQIARRLGVSHQWVNQVSRVLAASDLAEHVQTGRLSVAKAYQVQRAHSPEARRAALDAALGSASFRAIRNVAEGVSPTAADPPDSPATSADSTPTSPSPSFDRSETP